MHEVKYMDAVMRSESLREWELAAIVRKIPIAKRPPKVREHLLAIAGAPKEAAKFLSKADWDALDLTTMHIAEVFLATICDSYLHPKIMGPGLTREAKSAITIEAADSQTRAAITLLHDLPIRSDQAPKNPLDRNKLIILNADTPIFEETRRFLVKVTVDAWYKTHSQAHADSYFSMLMDSTRQAGADMVVEEVRKINNYAGTERIRKAILAIDQKLPRGTIAMERCLTDLAIAWLKRLGTSWVTYYVTLDDTLSSNLSSIGSEKLLETARQIVHLEDVARSFASSAKGLWIDGTWAIEKLDLETMTVHMRHRITLPLHDRKDWSDYKTEWQQKFEKIKASDPGATIHLTVYDGANPSDRQYHHTIKPKEKAV